MTTNRFSYLFGTLVMGASLGLGACGDDGGSTTDTPDAAPTTDAPPVVDEITATEVTGATFAGPESAHWDSAKNVWYVTSFGQNLDLSGETPDQPPYITTIGADGTVQEEKWFTANAGDLLGMATLDGTLYVAKGNELLAVNTTDATSTTITVAGAMFINDVAVGGGKVYFSDTVANRIYSYDPATPAVAPVVLTEDAMLVAPNGLLVDGDKLIVGTLGAFPPDAATPGGLYTVDLAGANAEVARLGELAGGFDGVEKTADGDYLVSDFAGKIYTVKAADGASELVADFAQLGLVSTADIGFDAATKTVMIPDLVGNKVFWSTLP